MHSAMVPKLLVMTYQWVMTQLLEGFQKKTATLMTIDYKLVKCIEPYRNQNGAACVGLLMSRQTLI